MAGPMSHALPVAIVEAHDPKGLIYGLHEYIHAVTVGDDEDASPIGRTALLATSWPHAVLTGTILHTHHVHVDGPDPGHGRLLRTLGP